MPEAARQWGSVPRHGAQVLGEASYVSASNAWRQAVVRARTDESDHTDDEEVWVRDDEPEQSAPRAKKAISWTWRGSVKSKTEMPPWYHACTMMSRPGTGISDPLCATQFQTGSSGAGRL